MTVRAKSKSGGREFFIPSHEVNDYVYDVIDYAEKKARELARNANESTIGGGVAISTFDRDANTELVEQLLAAAAKNLPAPRQKKASSDEEAVTRFKGALGAGINPYT